MCGHKKTRIQATGTFSRSYEGETIRLGSEGETTPEPACAWPSWKHVPWWTLWLIWPLFGLLKHVVAAAMMASAALLDLLAMVPLLRLWPVALILVGLLLLRRHR